MVVKPQGALRCRSSTSQFGPILEPFLDYYSPFWGSEAISIVVEPEGALTCRLSTLTVLADFGPFHGLLLTLRAENGVESFRFFGPKMETERKYENENGNLQNGN